MLDDAILQQLTSLYAELSAPLRLTYRPSEHAQQSELLDLLGQVAGTSPHLELVEAGAPSDVPRFRIERADGTSTGIAFVGIPGGHEFTSLVLAILNADGRGKLPDDAFQARIRRLKGPVHVRTFMSLSCENCPDVVQALNQMALIHDDFHHEVIDGAFQQDEVDRLKLRGVPAVVWNDELISSGKATLASLLERLEAKLGSAPVEENVDLGLYDVVVVGGGPAGAASAVYTARKGLKTLVLTDRLGGQLQDTASIENMISIPYTEGPELAANLGKHMEAAGVEVLLHRRVSTVTPGEPGEPIALALDSGESLQANALILATGAAWRELGVPGEKDYMGRGVAFCAHCDGPMFKGKDVVVVGGGNSGVEAAIDLANIVKSVTVLEFMPEPKADQVLLDKLGSLPNTKILTNVATQTIEGNDDGVTQLVYQDRADGSSHALDTEGVFVQIGLVPNSQFVKDVVKTNRYGEIEVDAKGRTSVPGIYAAGDVTTVPYKQIVVAYGEGAKAGIAAFEDRAFGR